METPIMPKFIHEYEREPEKIVKTAIETMGEDPNFFLWRLSKVFNWTKLNLKAPTITEWLTTCELIYLDVNSFQFGYCKRLHQVKIWRTIQKSRYYFRITPQIEQIIDQMYLEEENNWKWQIDHSGDPLRSRLVHRWQKACNTGYIGKKQPKVSKHIANLYRDFKTDTTISFEETSEGIFEKKVILPGLKTEPNLTVPQPEISSVTSLGSPAFS